MTDTPKWLRPLAAVALLWNLLGCAAFAADMMLTPDDVARMDVVQRAMYEARPAWSVIGTAAAVIGGALGSLGLLLSRRWAYPLLALSLAGVVVQDVGMAQAFGTWPGAAVLALQAVVLLVAIALASLARRGVRDGWLR
ncbi:hypothetical protein GCM10008101_13990 [Lysobacter xinjiangensis]|uniref:Sugar transporter n=1 Tax=Cognatilysobacter xinjiangensis TaxID=546892 RepID=A0ABQ3BXU7_9GAMM|nr:hypothetical protein [Lysobacter xinjiangensis]GGZ61217.1 hypothetical protein GCM10008101_13990 [Lysobacter xinjiangensis]